MLSCTNGQLVGNNFCSRPFTDLHIEENGNVTPCCVMPSNRFYMGNGVKDYFYGKPLNELQNQFIKDERPEQCEYCWQAEEVGLKTHRRNLPHKNLYQIHVRLNNVCNFKCRMCNPKFSSTWAAENKKHNYFEQQYSVEKDVFDYDPNLLPFIVTMIKKGGLKTLNISGGEPLITQANYKLLTYLIEHKATDVNICYSTNLSTINYNNVKLLDLWKKFLNVKLEVSCDGWGDSVEYSRTGFKMQTFMKNLYAVRHYVSAINCVVNIYSVWTLPYVEKLCERFKVKPVYAPCFLPDFLNPQRLVREDKLKLLEIYQSFPRLLEVYDNYISKDLPTLGKQMVAYNQLLDNYRDTDFFTVFPQYEKYKEL